MNGTVWDRGRYFGLIEDFAVPDPRVYWGDFLAATMSFYTAFWFLVLGPLPWYGPVSLFLVCCVLAFRCAAFLHEIVHQGPGRLPGFDIAYNWLFGYVFKLPTFLYTPHLTHHSTRVFAQDADPEYTRWSDWPALDIVRYILFVIGVFPGLLIVRLGFLPVLGPLLGSCARGWIDEKASTLSSNRRYSRIFRDDAERRNMRRQEGLCVAYNTAFLVLLGVGAWPWKVFWTWYGITGVAMAINFFRGLINHGYAHDGSPVSFEDMILDSTNVTRRSVWSCFWSPLNTRYHALHHWYPSLPYHALPNAHERLMAHLPADHPYRRTNKENYWQAFRDLVWSRRGPNPKRPGWGPEAP